MTTFTYDISRAAHHGEGLCGCFASYSSRSAKSLRAGGCCDKGKVVGEVQDANGERSPKPATQADAYVMKQMEITVTEPEWSKIVAENKGKFI